MLRRSPRRLGILLTASLTFTESLISQRSLFRSSSALMSSAVDDPVEACGLPSPIVLGSASFTRKLILKEMGVKYLICVRPINEKGLGDREKDIPSDLVLTLAKAKMDHLLTEIKEGRCKEEIPEQKEFVVLTGDQVVTCQGLIREKPESIDEAKAFVASYAESPPSTVGSCVLTHVPSMIQVSGVDIATIHFNDPPASLVDKLVAQDEPILSCAGGLMVEHPLVKKYITKIDGTQDSVMGLSKDLVLRLLQELSKKVRNGDKRRTRS